MVQEFSVLKIEPLFKKHIIQFQSLIQSKTGKYLSQGRAAALACMSMTTIIDLAPAELHKKGSHKQAEVYERIRDIVLEACIELAEGDLQDFDIENMFVPKT